MLDTHPSRAIQAQLTATAIGNDIATELEFVANTSTPHKATEIRALAGRIRLCNHISNAYFVPKAYERLDGSYSDTTGRFWRCHSKLCQYCLAHASRRQRALLRDVLREQRLRPGERFYFATLTIPNFGLPFLTARTIVNDAWTLLRKRSLSVSLIRGGFKSEEFTMTGIGVHYHTHHIWLSKFMDYQAMRKAWTDCVAKTFAAHGISDKWEQQQARRLQQWNHTHRDDPKKLANPDLNLSCRIDRIHDPQDIVNEVCKYITKGSSWWLIPSTDLANIALVSHWHRMTEFYGCFAPDRRAGQLTRTDRPAAKAATPEPILDTMPINDAASASQNPTWRQLCHMIDLEMFFHNIEADMDNARHWGMRQLQQRFPHTSVIPFDCL